MADGNGEFCIVFFFELFTYLFDVEFMELATDLTS